MHFAGVYLRATFFESFEFNTLFWENVIVLKRAEVELNCTDGTEHRDEFGVFMGDGIGVSIAMVYVEQTTIDLFF